MASGRNHDAAIAISTPVAGYLSYQLLGDWQLSIFSGASYLIGGLLLSPDLDISHSNPSRRWGYFRWIWSIYSKCIPHRHFLSHAPFIGSLGRIVYLNLWLSPLWIFGLDNPSFKNFVESDLAIRLAVIFFLAVEASAWNHLFLDGLIIPFPPSVKNFLAGKKDDHSFRRPRPIRKIYFRSRRNQATRRGYYSDHARDRFGK